MIKLKPKNVRKEEEIKKVEEEKANGGQPEAKKVKKTPGELRI